MARTDGARVRPWVYYALALTLLATAMACGVAIGSTPMPLATILRVLGSQLLPAGLVDVSQLGSADVAIVWTLRLPRVLIAAIVGAGLATAGALMQGLFRNPLAEPSLVGVGPGAVLGAVTAFVTGWSTASVIALPLAAVAGAVGALALVYGVATRGGATPITTLLLAGIAVGSLLTAVSSLMISLNIAAWQVAQDIVFWMMGGLDSRTWAHVWLSAPFVAIGIAAALLQARTLDLLVLGEDTALALGVDVENAKRVLVVTASLLTGAAVAVAGLVGFVGLVVPHAVRLLLGPVHCRLIPASAIGGAAFLVLADLLARIVYPPIELRLGIVTALSGAPFFLWILLRRLREARE